MSAILEVEDWGRGKRSGFGGLAAFEDTIETGFEHTEQAYGGQHQTAFVGRLKIYVTL